MRRFLLFSRTVQGGSALVSSSQPLWGGRIAGYALPMYTVYTHWWCMALLWRELKGTMKCAACPALPKPDGCHCGQDHLERSSFWRNWDRGWAMLLDSLLHNMGFQNSCLTPDVNLWLWHTGFRADWIPIAAFARNSYLFWVILSFDIVWRLLTHVQCWKLFDGCFVAMDISSIIFHMDPGSHWVPGSNPSRQIDRFPSCRTRVSATRREGRLMRVFPWFPFAALLSDIVLLSGDMMQSYITLYYIYYMYIYIYIYIIH